MHPYTQAETCEHERDLIGSRAQDTGPQAKDRPDTIDDSKPEGDQEAVRHWEM